MTFAHQFDDTLQPKLLQGERVCVHLSIGPLVDVLLGCKATSQARASLSVRVPADDPPPSGESEQTRNLSGATFQGVRLIILPNVW
jgi:hypothetical protein